MAQQFFRSSILANRWFNKAIRLMHARAVASLWREFGREGPARLERFGGDYGGWFAPVDVINTRSVIYSLGIGQDTTFDEALIDRYDLTVHGFDPTPAAVEHIARRHAESAKLRAQLLFEKTGVWDSDGTVRFYEPKTRGWVGSYSALNLQGTTAFIELPCKTLATLMRARGHERIDVLKMDIEGAEYRVLSTMLDQKIRVGWLCVEFDQPVPLRTTRAMLRRLADAGYLLRKVDRWNFVFEHVG